jgi:hypothetical protein
MHSQADTGNLIGDFANGVSRGRLASPNPGALVIRDLFYWRKTNLKSACAIAHNLKACCEFQIA